MKIPEPVFACTCPICHTNLYWQNAWAASKAFVHHKWWCGQCGAYVTNEVYGTEKKKTA
jgi:hypothetical protein